MVQTPKKSPTKEVSVVKEKSLPSSPAFVKEPVVVTITSVAHTILQISQDVAVTALNYQSKHSSTITALQPLEKPSIPIVINIVEP